MESTYAVHRSLMGYDISLVPIQDLAETGTSTHSLYISGARAARNEGLRRELKIYAILTIGPENAVNNFSARNVPSRYLCVGIRDLPTIQIGRHFPRMIEFMDQALDRGNLLVHCTMGVSRSSTVVIAYLMKRCGMNLNQAYKCLSDVRPYINPNPGFLAQLKDWEKTCRSAQKSA